MITEPIPPRPAGTGPRRRPQAAAVMLALGLVFGGSALTVHPAAAAANEAPPPPPAPAPPEFEGRLAIDGILGPKTARALQARLGVPVDGKVGPKTIGALQKQFGAPVDGIVGPVTVRIIQQSLGLKTNGARYLDRATVAALQRWLNDVPNPPVPVKPGEKVSSS